MEGSNRRHDIDWLRVLAVLLLVPFHGALTFSLRPQDVVYVKDGVESPALIQFAYFVHLWHMPLLFVLAGAGSWFALGFRSARRYLLERFLRLVVPMLFAVAVLVPPMVYLRFAGEPFWPFCRRFFRIDPGDLTGYRGTFTPAHLWFVFFLFVFSAASLPLLVRLRSRPPSDRLAAFAGRPGRIFLLALPLAAAVAVGDIGGKAPVFYLALFVYGYFWASDPRLQGAVDRHRTSALALGAVVTAGFHLLASAGGNRILIHILYYTAGWCWLVAILGFGRRWLDRGGAVLRYLGEASYPFYILHLPILTVVAYLVVRWPIGVAGKYLLLNAATILATYAVYEVLVRRTNPGRFLFGMKLRARD